MDGFLLGDDIEVGGSLCVKVTKVTENTWGCGEEKEGLQKRPGHPC